MIETANQKSLNINKDAFKIPVSRRKFLKLAAGTVAVIGVTQVLGGLVEQKISEDPETLFVAKTINGLFKDYIAAVKTAGGERTEKIQSAESNILNWILAYTAISTFKREGKPLPAKALHHFLEANGNDLDISEDFNALISIRGDKNDLDTENENLRLDEMFAVIFPGLILPERPDLLWTTPKGVEPQNIFNKFFLLKNGRPVIESTNVFAEETSTEGSMKEAVLHLLTDGNGRTSIFDFTQHSQSIHLTLSVATYTLNGNPNVSIDMVDVKEVEAGTAPKAYRVAIDPEAINSISVYDIYDFDQPSRFRELPYGDMVSTIGRVASGITPNRNLASGIENILKIICDRVIIRGSEIGVFGKLEQTGDGRVKIPETIKWFHHKGLSHLEESGYAKSFKVAGEIVPSKLPNEDQGPIVFYIAKNLHY